jgi:hypothetical protein
MCRKLMTFDHPYLRRYERQRDETCRDSRKGHAPACKYATIMMLLPVPEIWSAEVVKNCYMASNDWEGVDSS